MKNVESIGADKSSDQIILMRVSSAIIGPTPTSRKPSQEEVTMNAKYTKKELGQAVAMSALLTIFGSLAISESAADERPIPDPGITTKTVVVIPNHASYHYRIGSFTGNRANAPFGSDGGICPLQRTINTEWPANSIIVLWKKFRLPAGAENLRVQLSVDNDAEVFINEISIGSVTHDNCPLVDEFLLTAPPSALNGPGSNVIRVVARDRSVESFVDLRVLVDVPGGVVKSAP